MDSRNMLTDEEIQDAIDELIGSYVAKFGSHPDNVTGMVIRTMASRVAEGEPYHWEQQGQWRQIMFG